MYNHYVLIPDVGLPHFHIVILFVVCSDPKTEKPKRTLVWSKAVKGFRLRNEYVAKTYKFRDELMLEVVEHASINKLDKSCKRVRLVVVLLPHISDVTHTKTDTNKYKYLRMHSGIL